MSGKVLKQSMLQITVIIGFFLENEVLLRFWTKNIPLPIHLEINGLEV